MPRMYRRPVGWRFDSVRHGLAARGIRTRFSPVRYNADVKGMLASGINEFVGDKGKEEVKLYKHRCKDDIREHHLKVLGVLVEKGELHNTKPEEYVQHVLAPLMHRFERNELSESQFREEAKKSLDTYVAQNKTTFKLF